MSSNEVEPAGAGDENHDASETNGSSRPASAEDAMMDRFLRDYLALMPGRLAAITDFVDRLRYEEARVAILSLESASGMIGEPALRRLLHDLRVELDVCSPTRRSELIAAIDHEADAVRARLTAA